MASKQKSRNINVSKSPYWNIFQSSQTDMEHWGFVCCLVYRYGSVDRRFSFDQYKTRAWLEPCLVYLLKVTYFLYFPLTRRSLFNGIVFSLSDWITSLLCSVTHVLPAVSSLNLCKPSQFPSAVAYNIKRIYILHSLLSLILFTPFPVFSQIL